MQYLNIRSIYDHIMIKEIQLIFGFYPGRIIKSLKSLPWYRQTKREFLRQWKADNESFGSISSYPCLRDREEEGGSGIRSLFPSRSFCRSRNIQD